MNHLKIIKIALACVWLTSTLVVLTGAAWFRGAAAVGQKPPAASPGKTPDPADFVGTDTCAGCHDAQHTRFRKTPHAVLESDPSWKGKVTGCESCHGPGKAHVDAGGDKTKIRTFQNENSKQVSDTCLACHSTRRT